MGTEFRTDALATLKGHRFLRLAVGHGSSAARGTSGPARRAQPRAGRAGRRAELIARDQIGKLDAGLNACRQAAAGIEEYTWSNSKDRRVRDLHRERQEKTFRWDEPPAEEPHDGRAMRRWFRDIENKVDRYIEAALSGQYAEVSGTPVDISNITQFLRIHLETRLTDPVLIGEMERVMAKLHARHRGWTFTFNRCT